MNKQQIETIVILLVCIAFLTFLSTFYIYEDAHIGYIGTTGTVVSFESVNTLPGGSAYMPIFQFTDPRTNITYDDWNMVSLDQSAYPVGKTTTIYFNPNDPSGEIVVDDFWSNTQTSFEAMPFDALLIGILILLLVKWKFTSY